MVHPPVPFEQVAERVERLLLRHTELRRTNAILSDQVASLTRERDALRERLHAARMRVDAVLERLPETAAEDHGREAARQSADGDAA